VERARPDIIEVLPGVIFPEIVAQLRQRLAIPMIVGGFITRPVRPAPDGRDHLSRCGRDPAQDLPRRITR